MLQKKKKRFYEDEFPSIKEEDMMFPTSKRLHQIEAPRLILTTLASSTPEENVQLLRRSTRIRRRPEKDNDFVSLFTTLEEKEPPRYKVAISQPKWASAMNDEIRAFHINKTWELIKPILGMNVIGSQWVFRIKKDSQGKINRYKARLVAMGVTSGI